MWRFISGLAVGALIASSLTLWAQQKEKAKGKGDAGINPTTILDRAEVRIARVEIAQGAVRSLHAHDDVRFHLYIPLAGTLQLTVGSEAPVEAQPGQAFFIKGARSTASETLDRVPRAPWRCS